MSVALQVDILGAARVQRIVSRLGHLELHKLLDTVGNVVANQTRRRILHDKEAPDGSQWADYSKPYGRYKARVRPNIGMLQFDGHLLDSITHVVARDEVEVGAGSDIVYARRQHEMRPYLGLSTTDEDDVEEAVKLWIAAVVGVRL